MQDKLNNFEFELVVYDETEYFRAYNHKLFNYPFTLRKSKLTSFKFSIPTVDDYSFSSTMVKFQRSSACLEGSFLDQIDFLSKLRQAAVSFLRETIFQNSEPVDTPDIDEDRANCDSLFF